MTPFGSPPQKPPKDPPDKATRAEESKPSEPSKSSDDWAYSIGCGGLLVSAMFVALIFIAPHLDPNKEELDTAADARTAVTKLFSQALPTTDVKLKQLGGYNLEVWTPQKEFESSSYLDRKALMDATGKEWCTTTEFFMCPTVVVRDEKTGKNLAIYHCMFSYSDLNPN